jgi:hypothetical protein
LTNDFVAAGTITQNLNVAMRRDKCALLPQHAASPTLAIHAAIQTLVGMPGMRASGDERDTQTSDGFPDPTQQWTD